MPQKSKEALLLLLKRCAKEKNLLKGSKIHAQIRKFGILKNDIYASSTLINMYAKCGALAKAQEVFDELSVRDVVCWTALITGYAQHGWGKQALYYFERMKCEGFSPDAITFVSALKACASTGAVDKGREIHADIVRGGLLGKTISLGAALVDMYAKCGLLMNAREVFDELTSLNVVVWNVLIAGYAQHGHGEEALNSLKCMQNEGLSPDVVTFVCILKACGSIGAASKGKEIHDEVLKEGLLENNIFIGNALVDMYVKCGALDKAQEVFDRLTYRDVVSWNVLISGYVQHNYASAALDCFVQMQHDGLPIDAITFVSILKACGNLGAVDKGEEMRAMIVRQGLLEKDILIGVALLDMYAKCGVFAKAQEVFARFQGSEVATWNALITTYVQFGKDDLVCDLLDKMIMEGAVPNLITFTIVLNACSHLGMLDRGHIYFEMINSSYGIAPITEHYTCMVDLFGRAGHFYKALELITMIPASNCLPIWTALLGACRIWKNVNLGRWAFEHAVQLDKKHGAAYMCMSNLFAAAGMHVDMAKIDAMRVKNEAW